MKVAYESALGPTVSAFSSNMTDLVGGIASYLQENPELLKAVVAFGGAIGVATAGLAAYTVVSKVVIAMNAALAASAGPFMLVVGALALVAAGAAVMSSAIAEAQAELNALKDANAALIDAANAGAQAHLDKVAAIQTEANASRSLIDEIYSLADAENKTADEKQRLVTLVDLLNASIEGLNLQYDAFNDTMSHTREESEAFVDSLERQLRATAAQERAVELTRQQIQVEEQLNATLERKGEIDKYLDSLTSFQRWNNIGLRNESKALGRELEALTETQTEMAASMSYTTGIMDEMSSETVAAAEAAASAEAEYRALMNSVEAVEDATTEFATALQKLADQYDAVYSAALNSVQGQYKLWDEADKVIATATSNINSNLEGQATYWENYNTNLLSLSDRTSDVEGLSDVIASFADGSKDSVNAIAGMAAATDEELAGMVENWQNVQAQQEAVAQSIAELAVDVEGETANIVSSFEGMIADMELSDEARAAAEATISAYEASIRAGEGQVRGAIDRILAEVNRLDGVSASINFSVTGASGGVDGSHAGGLSYVPWDDYIARLHEGERVLTKEQNQYYTMAPQLMNALSARGNVTEAIGAMSSGGNTFSFGDIVIGSGGSGVSGSGAFADGLKEVIIETVQDYVHDQERRAYT
jgi:type II secretory pathway pseudopilin PulG/phage shock protein PspC (stress-responsive transcriptional regulator)